MKPSYFVLAVCLLVYVDLAKSQTLDKQKVSTQLNQEIRVY